MGKRGDRKAKPAAASQAAPSPAEAAATSSGPAAISRDQRHTPDDSAAATSNIPLDDLPASMPYPALPYQPATYPLSPEQSSRTRGLGGVSEGGTSLTMAERRQQSLQKEHLRGSYDQMGRQHSLKAGAGIPAPPDADVELGMDSIKAKKAPTAPDLPFYKIRTNPVGLCIYLLFLVVYVFYFYIRIRYTLNGGYMGYAIFVLLIEWLSSTNMLLYGLLLVRRKEYFEHPVTNPFHVRVLIPCYKEGCEIVSATATAACTALLPPGCQRTVYILDDGKDPDKRSWVYAQNNDRLVYIPGHIKQDEEINGKANNLNSALAVIYPTGVEPSLDEMITVFDADMVCTPDFFIKTLPHMMDDQVSLVLTPQAYHNYRTSEDIFNHSAFAYWNIMVPGEDAWGHIVCTGSNFVLRSRYAQEVGWFPTYTMCEDFALALELQAKKRKAAYVREFLAMGEVPTTVRGCFQQRSRWCKGGMQIWFSRRNWWLRRDIPFLQKLIWSISCWGYITHSISCPVFLAIPVIGIWFRIFPIENNVWFAAAFTLYFGVMHLMAYWCKDRSTFRSIWCAAINSNNMWWSFLKAWTNVMAGTVTGKQSGFKVTPKSSIATLAKSPKVTPDGTPVKPTMAQQLADLGSKLPPSTKDLWMPILILVINFATIGLGIYRLHKESLASQLETFSLVVSLAWAVYNTIPPLLLLHYAVLDTRGLRASMSVCSIIGSIVLLAIIVAVWVLLPPSYHFGEALKASMMFYQAEISGSLFPGYAVSWRGPSAMTDTTSNSANGTDLSGGFYDGGNGYLKMSYPIATSVAMLAWGLLEFPIGYERMNQTQAITNTIQHGADYLMKCAAVSGQFVVQVGSYDADQADLVPPELMQQARPVLLVNATAPGSDVVAASAAALAAASVVFNATQPAYSAALVDKAAELYVFAAQYQGLVGDVLPEVSNLYFSTSYFDDLAYAAAWLYMATGDDSYLEAAKAYKVQALSEEADADRNYNVWTYQNSLPGVNLLLAKATNFERNEYTLSTIGYLRVWMQGILTIRYTPRLLAWTPNGPLTNAANSAFLAVLYAKYTTPGKYECWAASQARYMLGAGGRSYVVGMGKNPPTRVWDKVSMCSTTASGGTCIADGSGLPNPHTNKGALVLGPDVGDMYTNDRTFHSMTGAHLINNAGFSGLMAALEQLNLNWASCTAGVNFVKMKIQGRPI